MTHTLRVKLIRAQSTCALSRYEMPTTVAYKRYHSVIDNVNIISPTAHVNAIINIEGASGEHNASQS